MDIWEKLYLEAKKHYYPLELNPFIYSNNVVCALETTSGKIFSGFCVESCCGVMDLCAERVAALNMYVNSGETKIKRLIVFKSNPPKNGSILPCGACLECLLQLDYQNKETEIMYDYESRQVVKLKELLPNWWGEVRYNN